MTVRNQMGGVLTRGKILSIAFVSILVLAGMAVVLLAPGASAQTTGGQGTVNKVANVSIKGFAFNPATITVVVGTNNTVIWTNNDSVTHTVTADDNSFNATVAPGQTFTHSFTAAGTFSYHCSIHKTMKGTVRVLGGATSSISTTATGGVPEFPFSAVAAAGITALLAVSYLALRRSTRG